MALANLKSLAKDAISIPSKEELYARKTSEIAAAKSALAKARAQIVAAEKQPALSARQLPRTARQATVPEGPD